MKIKLQNNQMNQITVYLHADANNLWSGGHKIVRVVLAGHGGRVI
jgi:dolichyl-phosphate-mannose--protein O-mannosyl transferase